MRSRTIPRAHLDVSEIGLPVQPLADACRDAADVGEAVALLREALERGITLLDAGEVDDDAPALDLLRTALAGRRDGVVLGAQIGSDVSPERLGSWCERICARLATDRLDLLQLRHPNLTALRNSATFSALEALVEDGRIGTYGIVVAPGPGAVEVARRAMDLREVPTAQIDFNLLSPDPGAAIAAAGVESDCAILVRDPHDAGLLEGKYSPQMRFPRSDRRRQRPEGWLQEGLRRVTLLSALADERECTVGQLAVAWLLAQPGVTAVLPTVHTESQLGEFCAGAAVPGLTEEELAAVAALQESGFAEPAPA
jgi:aryl-alcohol dehydrogenase-like predicted oxidoreductase